MTGDKDPAVAATRRAGLDGLAQRIALTYRYEGPRGIARRVARFPLRFTPRARRIGLSGPIIERRRRARVWAREQGPPPPVVPVAATNLRAAVEGAAGDVVLVGEGVKLDGTTLDCLRYAAHPPEVGVVGGRLVNARGRIVSAGVERAGEQLRPRLAGAPAAYGPAEVPAPVLCVPSSGMYVKHALIERVGLPEPGPAGAVDWCLRAWQSGLQVLYEPGAVIRGEFDGDALGRLQTPFFAGRRVSHGSALRIAYVTPGTGIWGGNRDVFEDLNRLAARGHDVSLYTLEPPPNWFALNVPVRTFSDYEELARELAPIDAIKVATWWATAAPVWQAAVAHGIAAYLVQDIETSYYPGPGSGRHQVLASYRSEFEYLTISVWIQERLRELGHSSELVAPGIDLGTFRPLSRPRREDMLLAIGRSNPLKRFDRTVEAWRALSAPRPELCVFGSEPDAVPEGARFVHTPSDAEVNELLNECTVFLQTSAHEGFGLPALEAMATGAPVVCTDAHGNRDYCRDGVNCLMPPADPAAIAGAVRSLLESPALRARLGAAGLATARDYSFEARTDALERWFASLADRSAP